MYLQERSFPQRGKHAAILLTQTMLPSLGYTSYKLEENEKEKHNNNCLWEPEKIIFKSHKN